MTNFMQENICHQIVSIASGSSTDDIFIVGKGPSIDELNGMPLPEGLVINLNDSERIRAGDIGIFSSNWVRHSLADSGFRCHFYLAGKPLPVEVPHEVLPPLPMALDDEELSASRLNLPEFYDEPLVLLTALKVCLRVATQRTRPQNVYLLGFDFSTQAGAQSAQMQKDFAGVTLGEREAVVHAQEYEFLQFLNYFKDKGNLRLIHVGHRDFSALTPAAFVQRYQPGVAGGRPSARPPVPADHVLIVAEFTNNHLGDRTRLTEMIERAKEAGADLIKIQKRDVATFYTAEQLASYYWSPFGRTLGDYRRGVELNDELLDVLDEHCRRCEIGWFSSVLDRPSYQALARLRPKLLKVPSTISGHREFHAWLAANYHGAIVVSTGFTTAEYSEYVLQTFANNERIYLLHCVSAYPTPREACNLAVVRVYADLAKTNPRIIPGYSSHDLGSLGCMLAVAGGARMIEKHVKLGDVQWVHFDKVAVDLKTGDFSKFVNDVRSAEQVFGSGEKRILECEHHKYEANRAGK